eukprot:TRINITY_DN51807_c0_g1_i1.p1 TRINITY_DN51807_c0_g1~~TRINITY_DN51807_c0_g1_i1.p1  ORF type:complete len:411 (+),score=49.76 TRINITY_DN51807_c0_g1_i1:113-1234(+)
MTALHEGLASTLAPIQTAQSAHSATLLPGALPGQRRQINSFSPPGVSGARPASCGAIGLVKGHERFQPLRQQWPRWKRSDSRPVDRTLVLVPARDQAVRTKVGTQRCSSAGKFRIDAEDLVQVLREAVPYGSKVWCLDKLEQAFQARKRHGSWLRYRLPFQAFLALFPRTFALSGPRDEHVRLRAATCSGVADKNEEVMTRLALALADHTGVSAKSNGGGVAHGGHRSDCANWNTLGATVDAPNATDGGPVVGVADANGAADGGVASPYRAARDAAVIVPRTSTVDRHCGHSSDRGGPGRVVGCSNEADSSVKGVRDALAMWDGPRTVTKACFVRSAADKAARPASAPVSCGAFANRRISSKSTMMRPHSAAP